MRKTIPIVAALLAAFFLTSCDQILEGFYPEFADTGTGKGGVVVSINYDPTLLYVDQGQFNLGTARLAVGFVPFISYSDRYEVDEGNIQILSASKNDFLYDPNKGGNYKDFKFEVKTNATYKVIAWLDLNNDQEPEDNEPGSIVYSNTGDFFLDLRYYRPDQDTIFLGNRLRDTDTINWEQFMSDPFAQGTGARLPPEVWLDSYVNMTSAGSNLYFSMSYFDQDGWVNNFEWTLTDPYSNTTMYYGQYVSIYFSDQGIYTLSYRAKDNDGNWSAEQTPVTITVGAGGGTYDAYPTASFGVSDWSPTAGDTVWFYNYSYDYDSFGNYLNQNSLSSSWTIYDSNGGLVASFSGIDFNYTFASGGNYQVSLSVTDSMGQTSTTSNWLWVEFGASVPGASASYPVELGLGASYFNIIPLSQSQYYHFSLPGFGIQNLRFTGLSADVDFTWYADPGFVTQIGSSSAGGTADESFSVSGYTNVYLKAYGYQAGNYTVSVTSY